MPNSSTRAALPAAATPPEYTAAGATLASITPKRVTNARVQSSGQEPPFGQPQYACEQPHCREQQGRVRAGIAQRNRQRRQQYRRAAKQREPPTGILKGPPEHRRDHGGRCQRGLQRETWRERNGRRPHAEQCRHPPGRARKRGATHRAPWPGRGTRRGRARHGAPGSSFPVSDTGWAAPAPPAAPPPH